MTVSLLDFLAHAIAMESEAAERYLELADMMEVHNNAETARVFRDMSRFSAMHHDDIQSRVGAVTLPRPKPWEYRWVTPPEVGEDEGLHYLMTPYHALKYARENEIRGMEYYRAAASDTGDPEVRKLGTTFAGEEAQHVAALDRWLSTVPRPAMDWDEDLDPAQAVD